MMAPRFGHVAEEPPGAGSAPLDQLARVLGERYGLTAEPVPAGALEQTAFGPVGRQSRRAGASATPWLKVINTQSGASTYVLVDDRFFYAYCELYLGLVCDPGKAASRLAWLLGAREVDLPSYGASR